MNRYYRPLAFCTSILMFLGFSLGAGLTESLERDANALIGYYLAMSFSALAVWAFFPNHPNKRQTLIMVFGLAVVSRIMMTGFPVSDDVNRYLWEGKLLLAGESPYAQTADSPDWNKHRDRYWELMNHKDKLTAYPPLALILFAGLNLIDYHPWVYKLFFGLIDLAALGIIIRMLGFRKLPIRNSLLYALNPITLIAFSGEAHFDALFVFLMLCALAFADEKKETWAWILLGLSIQIKLMSILLFPLLFLHFRTRKVLWITAPLLLPCLFFWQDLPNLLNGILNFGGTMSHNGSINHLLIDFFGDRGTASKLSLALLTVVVLITSLKAKDLLKGGFIIMGGLILLSPTVHYWYLSWVLPFVVFFPSLPWVVLLALSAFYFSAWVQFGKTGEWYQSIGYLRLQWIPFYVLWTPMFVGGIRRLFREAGSTPVESLSAVIPILNESGHLAACLKSLNASLLPLKEIVIVDGGSTDNPSDQTESFSVQLISSEKGRGCQIATGIKACTADAVVVLHADAQISPETASHILDILNANPETIGGAIGQRFVSTQPKPVLVLIEALNDFKAQFQGNSFGDQGQFFRRSKLNELGGFPDIPLMEDVELTTRLKRGGDQVLLDCSLKCSARRWERDHALKRIFQVLSLVVRYKFLRLLGKDPSRKLFKEYYS